MTIENEHGLPCPVPDEKDWPEGATCFTQDVNGGTFWKADCLFQCPLGLEWDSPHIMDKPNLIETRIDLANADDWKQRKWVISQ